MREDVKRDYDWQRKFLPQIIEIVGSALGPYLFREAPPQQDMEENSDLLILQANDIRVACRVRKANFYDSWPHDVTIRSWRKNSSTEIHKLMNGFGDAFFYGFADIDESKLQAWRLLSLDRFRKFFEECKSTKELVQFATQSGIDCSEIDNHDGQTRFLRFEVRDLERNISKIIITSNPPLLSCEVSALPPVAEQNPLYDGQPCFVCGAPDAPFSYDNGWTWYCNKHMLERADHLKRLDAAYARDAAAIAGVCKACDGAGCPTCQPAKFGIGGFASQ